jgi:hypothetical protein
VVESFQVVRGRSEKLALIGWLEKVEAKAEVSAPRPNSVQ